ncbi:MAG TPA: hypothetical protein VFB45_26565 [Pseudolabrys sp.]|nr:hypothetical protein [Pseudolabrys sp.]
MTATPDECRREAEECRHLADSALTPEARANWLNLADEWEKLATIAETKLTEAGEQGGKRLHRRQ